MNPLAFCQILLTCGTCLQSPGCMWVGGKSISPCRGDSLEHRHEDKLSSNPQIVRDLKDCPGGATNITNHQIWNGVGRFGTRGCKCPPVNCPNLTQTIIPSSDKHLIPCLEPTQKQCAKWIPPINCTQNSAMLTQKVMPLLPNNFVLTAPTASQCSKFISQINCPHSWYNTGVFKTLMTVFAVMLGIFIRPYLDKWTQVFRLKYTRTNIRHALII